jgi:iron complex outermembrane recepter protein
MVSTRLDLGIGRRRLLQSAACSAFWLATTVATAQQSPATGQGPQAAGNSSAAPSDYGIAEIIVTAQRRAEDLQDVPIAVTAVTASMLEARGTTNTTELIASVPSLTLSTSGGYFQPHIRGIGNSAVGAGFEGGVAVYVDGVYMASPATNLFSLSNIDRIEVLKGPQGTLFGRNTTGGLIQIITEEPSETFGGNASVTAANYKDYTGDFYVTGGLAPGVAANFAAHYENQGEGWGRNEYNGEDADRMYNDIMLRASLMIEPSDSTKIRIIGDYSNTNSNFNGSQAILPGTGFPYPGLVRPTGSPWNINVDTQPVGTVWNTGASLHVTQDLGFASLIDITAYRESEYSLAFDGDLSNLPLVSIDVAQPDRQFTEELQLASDPASTIKWLVGAFYIDASSYYDPVTAIIPGALSQSTSDQMGTQSIAGYGQATAPLYDATNLTLGLRYTHERKDLTDISEDVVLATPPSPPPFGLPSQSQTYEKPTWRASLDHRFTPELMVYASYNRGFKSGGFNGQVPTEKPFLPESLDAYEIGAKSDLFDRHLRIDASTFFYNYTNIQVTRYVDSQQQYYNGAAARLYGLDLDFDARLTSQFSLSGGFTWIHDRFTNFPNAVISLQVPTGLDIITGSATGNKLPLAPDFSGTVTAMYKVPTALGEASFDASYTYNSGYFTQPDNILRQPSYNLVSFGGRLTFQSGLYVRVWMRNALNTQIYSANQAGTFDSGYSLEAPRTYGVTVGGKF